MHSFQSSGIISCINIRHLLKHTWRHMFLQKFGVKSVSPKLVTHTTWYPVDHDEVKRSSLSISVAASTARTATEICFLKMAWRSVLLAGLARRFAAASWMPLKAEDLEISSALGANRTFLERADWFNLRQPFEIVWHRHAETQGHRNSPAVFQQSQYLFSYTAELYSSIFRTQTSPYIVITTLTSSPDLHSASWECSTAWCERSYNQYPSFHLAYLITKV